LFAFLNIVMKFKKFISLTLILLSVSGCDNLISRDTAPTRIFMSSSNPPHVLYAASYVGYSERSNRREIRELTGVDPVRTEWCAAFVNAILERHGIPGSESVSEYPLMARSFLDWGESVDEPQRGDIVVFTRGSSGWQGHVAIYLGSVERDGRIYYRILGGNQNNAINVSEYPASRLLGIRRIENPPQRVWRVALN
jgi:uncharacterized protein (TIGR02594 family)